MFRCPERRIFERFPVEDMKASISIRYRFGTNHGEVLDFNRYGITVVLRRPVPVNKPLFVTLTYGTTRLEAIVGAAHHCRFTSKGIFRCGIRFRTNSPNQLDRDEIDIRLESLEKILIESLIRAAT